MLLPYDHPEFNSPSNAVIYNEDKSIYMRLALPIPVSEQRNGRGGYVNDSAFVGLYIGGVVWGRNEDGEMGMALNLVFDKDYCETRALNYITGEVGECLGSFRL